MPALLFDLDGLLIDSEPLYHGVEVRLLGEYGVTDFSILKQALGMKAEEAFALFVDQLGLKVEPTVLVDRCGDMMLLEIMENLNLMPEVKTCLGRFHGVLPMAVASASRRPLLEAALTRFDLHQYFKAIVSGDDAIHGKPNPEIFLLAASKLGINPSECVVFEDAPHGVQAAKRAGMFCVAVPNATTKGRDFSLADVVISDLGQVDQGLIERLMDQRLLT
jgi:beta-phosphoglucomutase-like phosphatase (HAD superfamily)